VGTISRYVFYAISSRCIMPNVRSIKEILCERHGVCTVAGCTEPASEQHHVLYDPSQRRSKNLRAMQ
jgi:hypothetical protein